MAALDSLSFTSQTGLNWQATLAATGLSNGIESQETPAQSVTLGTDAANAAAGGADQLYATVLALPASGATTINLQSFTDVVGRAAQSFARVKAVTVQLLSATDSVGGVDGTGASSITVGNALTNPTGLFLASDTLTFNVKNGQKLVMTDPGAAGWLIDSTHKSVKFLNNDTATVAQVFVVFAGGTS